MKTVLLHGLGQNAESWKALTDALGTQDILCPDLWKLMKGTDCTYPNLYRAFSEYCESILEPFQLCGHSLGGVLALNYAMDYPEKVQDLVLIAAPYRMPKMALRLQNTVFRLMPGRAFQGIGLSKHRVLQLTRSMVTLDLTKGLCAVTCPALILCGEKDRANRKAARRLHRALPQSKLQWIPGAGHEANRECPQELARILRQFEQEIGA